MRPIHFFNLLLLILGCQGNSQNNNLKTKKEYTIFKTDSEWRAELSQMSYYVLRKSGTERAFSGPLNYNKKKGLYVCAGCDTPLYESQYKLN